jgi:hypothetical protein
VGRSLQLGQPEVVDRLLRNALLGRECGERIAHRTDRAVGANTRRSHN